MLPRPLAIPWMWIHRLTRKLDLMRSLLGLALMVLLLGACATTSPVTSSKPASPVNIAAPAPAGSSEPVQSLPSSNQESPVDILAPSSSSLPAVPSLPLPPVAEPDKSNPFRSLPFWQSAEFAPALSAFRRTCQMWSKQDPSLQVHEKLPEYGRLWDWTSACQAAESTGGSEAAARQFFETEFVPMTSASTTERGLITGYFQPAIDVRRRPTAEFSEPILAVPTREDVRTLPRSKIGAASSRVIAFGRPMEVFFMQIQGSGQINFEDGSRMRAAYAGNNGYKFTSLAGVLIRRGEMTPERASKQSIEAWMRRAGPVEARALMNENKRYIFFKEEPLVPGEGPKGSVGVPLTAMGSLAVDPRHHPYGVPVWLTVNIPQFGGDYIGQQTGLLLVPQDTGKAIRGAKRGDLYFGEGAQAGAKAGVMKHRGEWVILLPAGLALRLLGVA